jgi:hypothetical protein
MLRFCRNKASFFSIAVLLSIIAPMFAIAQVAWVRKFDDALKQAAREKKFIVLDISASW